MLTNLVYMFIFHIKTSFITNVIFCILSFSDITCEIAYENTSVNILFIYCQSWFIILQVAPNAFINDINFFIYFYWLKSVKYIWLFYFDWPISVKGRQSFMN